MEEQWQVMDKSQLPDMRTRGEMLADFLDEAKALKPGQFIALLCPTVKISKAAYVRAWKRLTNAGIKGDYTISYREDKERYLVIIKRK